MLLTIESRKGEWMNFVYLQAVGVFVVVFVFSTLLQLFAVWKYLIPKLRQHSQPAPVLPQERNRQETRLAQLRRMAEAEGVDDLVAACDQVAAQLKRADKTNCNC